MLISKIRHAQRHEFCLGFSSLGFCSSHVIKCCNVPTTWIKVFVPWLAHFIFDGGQQYFTAQTTDLSAPSHQNKSTMIRRIQTLSLSLRKPDWHRHTVPSADMLLTNLQGFLQIFVLFFLPKWLSQNGEKKKKKAESADSVEMKKQQAVNTSGESQLLILPGTFVTSHPLWRSLFCSSSIFLFLDTFPISNEICVNDMPWLS